jgi:hypothetical protein
VLPIAPTNVRNESPETDDSTSSGLAKSARAASNLVQCVASGTIGTLKTAFGTPEITLM